MNFDYFRPLWEDSNGDISSPRIWRHVAYFIGSWVMVKMTPDHMSFDIFLAYMACVAADVTLSKWLTYRYSQAIPTDPAAQPPAPQVVVENATVTTEGDKK